ncbi:hypothetical protein [Agrobacterium pusense]|uniref:hypothetical protein n=1 Tax=Agrobacterium pusense TaxID=648995 RepID=UPI002FDCEC01
MTTDTMQPVAARRWDATYPGGQWLYFTGNQDGEKLCLHKDLLSLASTLESLQRENEDLREDRDRTARNRDMYKGQVERQADKLSWYRSGSFAHAVNEHLSSAGISVNGDILHDCIRRTALASTGGEHHADK